MNYMETNIKYRGYFPIWSSLTRVYVVTSAQKGCKQHFGQNSFFALTGVYGQDTLSGKVLHLDFV